MPPNKPWIGYDLDGTLAEYHGQGILDIGNPIETMITKLKLELAYGHTIKIFTARAVNPEAVLAIKKWCLEHIGQELEVTDRKDFDMVRFYDDRAVEVVFNTGMTLREIMESQEEWKEDKER